MQITGALVKFLICRPLLLSLDEELADLSLPLAFSPVCNSCFKKLAKKFFVVPDLLKCLQTQILTWIQTQIWIHKLNSKPTGKVLTVNLGQYI